MSSQPQTKRGKPMKVTLKHMVRTPFGDEIVAGTPIRCVPYLESSAFDYLGQVSDGEFIGEPVCLFWTDLVEDIRLPLAEVSP